MLELQPITFAEACEPSLCSCVARAVCDRIPEERQPAPWLRLCPPRDGDEGALVPAQGGGDLTELG